MNTKRRYISPDLHLFEVGYVDINSKSTDLVIIHVIANKIEDAIAMIKSYYDPNTNPKIGIEGYINHIKELSFGEVLIDEQHIKNETISWEY